MTAKTKQCVSMTNLLSKEVLEVGKLVHFHFHREESQARPPEEAGGSTPGLRPLARSQDPGRPARPEGRAVGPFREGPRRRRGDPESTWPGGTPEGGETEGTWRGTRARPKAGPEGTPGQPGDRSESEA